MKVHCVDCDKIIEMKDYNPSDHSYGRCVTNSVLIDGVYVSTGPTTPLENTAYAISFVMFMSSVFIPIGLFHFEVLEYENIWDILFGMFAIGLPICIGSVFIPTLLIWKFQKEIVL